ncbi:MAG: hypothetical protein BWY78_00355 [Alphaproteobacteria bacterium ADurb.Bin438]|nr:MAG: hypothetical protein BWY78_00355 [Alphaproteobacteria bacterium ADurb.Bin438]
MRLRNSLFFILFFTLINQAYSHNIIPYKAVYDVSLVGSDETKIEKINGKMEFELKISNGYVSKYFFNVLVEFKNKEIFKLKNALKAFEDFESKKYQYTFIKNQEDKQIKILSDYQNKTLIVNNDGKIKNKITNQDVLTPINFLKEIIHLNLKTVHSNYNSFKVIDGNFSDGFCTAHTYTELVKSENSTKKWKVSIEYVSENEMEDLPLSNVQLIIDERGVIHEIIQKYPKFKVKYNLFKLDEYK